MGFYAFAKRIFDLLLSFLGVCVLLPIFLIISLLIIFDDGFPIIYRQKRVGLDGKSFKILKFRSMVVHNKGPEITVLGDKRVTRVGEYIRRYKIDELPQLFNVLSGEMSFVGPRPEVRKYVDLYSDEQKKILSVKPGITDLASIEFINESEILASSEDPEKAYVEEIMPRKISINLEYLKHRSLCQDLFVIGKTILSIKG